MSAQPATASKILAAVGVPEDHSFYREFTTPEEKAVLTVPQRISHAWLTNDADAFADVFTENGSLLLQDEQLTSREQIRAFLRTAFDSYFKGARVNGWPLQVTFLSDDTAMVITQGGIIRDGETEISPERQIRATWVVTRRDDRWVLVSHQSSPIKG